MDKVVNLGPEANFEIKLENGKIVLAIAYAGKDLSAIAQVATSPDQLCHALAELIPGDSAAEKAGIAALKLALNALM